MDVSVGGRVRGTIRVVKTAKAFGPTARLPQAPVAVVVSASAQLVESCRRAVLSFSCADVESAPIAEVASVVSKMRPFAIVVDENIYAFDPSEFTALARDVHADVIRVRRPDAPVAQMIPAIKPALQRAFGKHGRRTRP